MAFCANCGTDLLGRFCSSCGQAQTEAAAAHVTIAPPQQRHGLPALLSFFLPGLGQIVKGQFFHGLFIAGIALLFGALCVVYVGFVLLPIFWIWNIYDSYVAPDSQAVEALRAAQSAEGASVFAGQLNSSAEVKPF